MRPRLLPALLLAFGVAPALATAAAAQDLVFLAFGDSITEGYGDTSHPGGGYPARLQRWLRQQGYTATVENYGLGGETTSAGLSRIDSVLAGGGDYLLLMEGTNDISQRVGVESIRFNLDEMAGRAEALGIVAVHASVIPRVPTAPADASNAATSALALAIRTMGESQHRAVADQFTLFEGLPDLFENYYYYDPEVIDIVGHPNSDGYTEIAGLFLETLLPLLETPVLQIEAPPGPLQAGWLLAFGVSGNALDEFVHVEWDFGDGGFAATPPPSDFSVFYVYLHPGTYTATVRGVTAGGAVSESSVQVVIGGSEPAWQTASTMIPLVLHTQDGQIASDLVLANGGSLFGIAEATLQTEIQYDDAPPVRRFLVPVQGSTTITEVLSTGFGLGAARGALRIDLYAYPLGSTSALTAATVVHAASDPDGDDGAFLTGLPSSAWNAAGKQIFAIPNSADAVSTLAITNLDAVPGTVSFDLFDANGAAIGSGVLELGANATRLRSLSDLFRDLALRPAPFRAVFAPSGIRFSAAILIANAASGEVVVLTGTP